MRRVALLFAVLCILPVLALCQQPKRELPNVEMIPDPIREFSPGDRAVIWMPESKGALAAIDLYSWFAYSKTLDARDSKGAMELAKAKKLVSVAHLTPFLILDTLPEASINKVPGLEIRVEGGEHNGRRLWVSEGDVTKLIRKAPAPPGPAPKLKARPKPKTVKPDMPAEAASKAYRDARKLEADGKLPEAIRAYEALSASIYPEARLARERLKVLTGK